MVACFLAEEPAGYRWGRRLPDREIRRGARAGGEGENSLSAAKRFLFSARDWPVNYQPPLACIALFGVQCGSFLGSPAVTGSQVFHSSTILPSAMRLMLIPINLADFPVSRIVTSAVKRVTTLLPSAI